MGKQASWQSAHLKKKLPYRAPPILGLSGAGRQLPQARSSRQELRWLQGMISQSSTCSSSNPSACTSEIQPPEK